jgi:aspartate/methionine/tyrosine aminotransferase
VEELKDRCHKAGVEFTFGTFFGEQLGEYHVRFNLACQHERVIKAAESLEKAVKG